MITCRLVNLLVSQDLSGFTIDAVVSAVAGAVAAADEYGTETENCNQNCQAKSNFHA